MENRIPEFFKKRSKGMRRSTIINIRNIELSSIDKKREPHFILRLSFKINFKMKEFELLFVKKRSIFY